MSAIVPALSAALVHFVWEGLLVTWLLWITLYAMRRRAPGARYLVSCVALLAMTVAPLLTAAFLYSRPAAAMAAADVLIAAGSIYLSPAAGRLGNDWLGWSQIWALPVWCAGVLILSLRLAWGCRQIRALRRCAEMPGEMVFAAVSAVARRIGLSRPVDVRISRSAESPGVIGWLRPVILVPASTIAGLTPEQLESVLAHELAHIRRYDYLINAAQILVETLLFYHPCVWWTSAHIRRERELCCDDMAVHACGDAVCYARALTKLERLRPASPNLAVGSTGGSLLYRIQRLLGVARPEYVPSKLPVVLGLSFAVTFLMVNLSDGGAQTKPEQPVPAPPAAEQVLSSNEVRPEPNKRREQACSDRDMKKVQEFRLLQQEKRDLELALESLRAQANTLATMALRDQANTGRRHRMVDLNVAISKGEVRLEQLRKTSKGEHLDVQAAEAQLQALKAQRDQLEWTMQMNAIAEANDTTADPPPVLPEKMLDQINLKVKALEKVLLDKDQEIRDTMAKLTARQKGCLAR